MHPALRLENLDQLPPSMRRVARRACSATRSIDDIRRIQTYIATATETQTLLMLPIFYTNLDPLDVPDQDQYDTENPPADAESRIGRALLSLVSLYVLEFPVEIGPEIWPRVWPWVQFIYTYRDHLPNIPSQAEGVFCLEFLMFAGTFARHEETFSIILSIPGVWFFVAKAWPLVPKILDLQKRVVGFTDLRSFISEGAVFEPVNLAELIDGAGGTLDHLAHLTAIYLEAMIPANGDGIDYKYVLYLCDILDFAAQMEPAFRTTSSDHFGARLGAFGAALTAHNSVQTLTRILCVLEKVDSALPIAPMVMNAMQKSLWILGSILVSTPGKTHWLSDALEAKLLRTLIVHSGGPHAKSIQRLVPLFLTVILPPRLVYPGVLAALDGALDDVDELVTAAAFKKLPIYERWVKFSELAEERISVLDAYNDRETQSQKACDNLECGIIRLKSTYRKCSGCLSLYYCSKPCQALDWTKGGHRRVCRIYGHLSLPSDKEINLTARQRSFLRTLVHHEYMKILSKVEIFSQTVAAMATHSDEGTLVLYDYTEGPAKINLQPLSGAGTKKALGGPEWTDIVSRAQRSGWRMRLDVLVFSGPNGTQYYVVPLRSNNSTIHDRLQALADLVPRDREVWGQNGTAFATSIGELFFSLEEDDELVEVH
ncbi:hypothetical protein C8R47DRAFT_1255011 [Mycena vitilis]|nr:hypothetical protein C8R47DRAFT_1255011 [Mycena vitilis]